MKVPDVREPFPGPKAMAYLDRVRRSESPATATFGAGAHPIVMDRAEGVTVHEWWRKLMATGPFTALRNVTGAPALSLPLGMTPAGLPVGVQFVGRYLEEATLIRLAAQLEQTMPWSERLPPVHAA